MTTWTTADVELLRAVMHLMDVFDHEIAWTVGTQGITEFRTKRKGGLNTTKWTVAAPPDGRWILAMLVMDICELRGAIR